MHQQFQPAQHIIQTKTHPLFLQDEQSLLSAAYFGKAASTPSSLILASYCCSSANASSGESVTAAPVRRETGFLEEVCLISRWAVRTWSVMVVVDWWLLVVVWLVIVEDLGLFRISTREDEIQIGFVGETTKITT